ncbi:EamA family transporter [Rhodobacteraceae bacterium 2CG4]|uniref:EamA family transporter n=1 Tax=Halovulum marinum TaxID=2662447 RepID=A0A6L5YWM6_9RHOB|nr:DMT family transporter [Halovulum marinum]MSU88255.1 EamA family transporter [Halovulum marinum]
MPRVQPLGPHTAPAPRAGGDNIPAGIALMITFAVLAPWIDIFAKLASGMVPPVQLTLARFVVQAAVLLPVLALRRRRLRPARGLWPLHAARGALMAVASTAFIAAVQAMPIADAMAIFFVAPLLLTAISGLVLGEEVGWRRLTACTVGFLGALLVVRPSFAELGPVALLPLLTASCFVLYVLLTRRVARDEGPVAMQAYAGISGALVMALALALLHDSGWPAFAAVRPALAGWALMVAVGAAATTAHLFLVAAYARAPAPLLAPLQYLEIVSATVFGYWLFGDFPDALKWTGIAIIVGSGLFVIWRERRAARG